MKKLRATLAALLISGSIALPVLAETTPAPLFNEQAEVGLGSGVFGEAEWSETRGIYGVQLRSWQALLSSSGYSLILIKALAKDFEQLPKTTRLRFHMEFKKQVHPHVRPTIRVEYLYLLKGKIPCVGRFDLDWNEYKDMLDPDTANWYDINLAKLLEEKANKVHNAECRIRWIAIGGRELHRSGFGNNGFMDLNIAGLSLSQMGKEGAKAAPIKFNTDVKKENNNGANEWSKELNGTM